MPIGDALIMKNDIKPNGAPEGADPINFEPIDSELDAEQALKAQQAQEEAALLEEAFVIKMATRRDERYASFYLVYAVDRSDYAMTLDEAVDAFEKGFEVTIPARSLARILAQGAIDNRTELDEQIKPYLKNWELERLGCCTRLILRLALWELQQSDAVTSIVINEAVELAKAFAEKDAYRFVNGILDEMVKTRQAAQATEAAKEEPKGD